jgi:TetR/AcrR family transcriptional regulator
MTVSQKLYEVKLGTAERREREKEYRKQMIIEAAEKVFFSKGFEKATMDDVAKESELSKGTLYLYFKSKEEVYLQIIVKGMKILRQMFEDAVLKEPNGLCKVRAIGETYIRFNREYPHYYDALLYFGSMEINIETPEAAELKTFIENKDVMDIFISVIKEGLEDGTLRQEIDPEKTALSLWGATSGILQLQRFKGHALSYHFDVNQEELISYYMNFVYHSLKAD